MGCISRLPAVALACLAASPASALDSVQLSSRVAPSVYGVRTFGANDAPLGGGSAVVVSPGVLATACHVLAGAHAIAVRRDNVSFDATLDAPDVERDLCLLKVSNFTAPAVAVVTAPPGFGQKVYAASTVDGRALTLRDATVTGLQAGQDGKLERIQLSVGPDPAANGRDSGGGLFDDSGRLVGILSKAGKGADGQLRVLPASWIAEARTRGAAAVAGYRPAGTTVAVPPVANGNAGDAVATPAAQSAAPESPRVGEQWIYTITDKLTGRKRTVAYRVDRIDGGRVVFNQGARIELKDGRLVRIETPIAGEFDQASPPQGWVRPDVKTGMRWKLSYRQTGTEYQTDLTAVAMGETTVRVPAGTLRVMRVKLDGYVQRPFYNFPSDMPGISTPFNAVAWYSPELRRVVRFESRYSSRFASGEELVELSEHRFD
ncbi:S1-C subfamily serine protease [Cupriavidus gilardii J11]|uniref:S1-C subfamily serine protease n=1 Tax=Cupriavidus gilardii J11 TaxID=936133 RepID=A0A562BU89_9BURK|nr:serine protease [Cupriavidus gilardii]TWG88811.1 S1-C subfamily serine protease [Cupriavidus gilardii J11]